jgi:hypothetical protein
MELKEFMKTTIVHIVEGINEANAALTNNTAYVVSSNIQTNESLKFTTDTYGKKHYVTDLEFDVAINVQTSETKEGGVGIEVLTVLKARGKGSKENTSSSISRIKFSIPLAIPTELKDKLHTKHT